MSQEVESGKKVTLGPCWEERKGSEEPRPCFYVQACLHARGHSTFWPAGGGAALVSPGALSGPTPAAVLQTSAGCASSPARKAGQERELCARGGLGPRVATNSLGNLKAMERVEFILGVIGSPWKLRRRSTTSRISIRISCRKSPVLAVA